MSDPKWLSPRKLREYYVDHAFADVREAEEQLFLSVTKGEVRARSKNRVFGPEWLKQIAQLKVDERTHSLSRPTLSCRSKTQSGNGPPHPK